jgi:hypothetical protein
LRFGEGGRDIFQVGTDFGQLLGLSTQRLRGALDFGGVVDRVIAILMIPGRVEAATGFAERIVASVVDRPAA